MTTAFDSIIRQHRQAVARIDAAAAALRSLRLAARDDLAAANARLQAEADALGDEISGGAADALVILARLAARMHEVGADLDGELGLPPSPPEPEPTPEPQPVPEQQGPAAAVSNDPEPAFVRADAAAAEIAAELEAWRTGHGIEETCSELPLPPHLAAATAAACTSAAKNGAKPKRKRR